MKPWPVAIAGSLLFSGLLCLGQQPQAYWQSRDQISIAATYVGPSDINGTSFVFWSTRCINAVYTGNVISVWDGATGNTTHTLVTCSSGGVLNETINSLATTCAVACVVDVIYDQSGSTKCTTACDVTQATNSLRPTLTVSCQNGKMCVQPNGGVVIQCLASPAVATTQAQIISLSTVFNNTGANANRTMFAAGADVIFAGNSTANLYSTGSSGFFTFTANDNTNHAIQTQFNGASGAIYIDGSATTGQNFGANGIPAAAFGIGAGNGCTNNAWTGNFFELGLWTGDKSANNSTMNGNQHTYWNF